jgi:hypothetical protein
MSLSNVNFTGLSVAQVLARCAVDYEQLRLIDDPPGVLRAIELPDNACGGGKRIILDLSADNSLFSPEMNWPQEAVLRLKVTNVLDSADNMF